MLQKIRRLIRNNTAFRKFASFYLASSGLFDKVLLNMPISESWDHRIKHVVSCPDNEKIPRVLDAGQVKKGKQIMHNGLLISLGGYYGPEMAQLLLKNRGVHEPQQELVFGKIIDSLPRGATMIELGAFWGFYSMWFNNKIKDAHNYLIEPSSFNLNFGIRNFSLNNMYGDFTNAYIGKEESSLEEVPTLNIDYFVRLKQIKFIDLLHSDIQGYEHEMLQGAEQTIIDQKIGYFFISTHNDENHYACIKYLTDRRYDIICSATLTQSYSEDGLIVAKHSSLPTIDNISISLKS